jgi:hypothetical protein
LWDISPCEKKTWGCGGGAIGNNLESKQKPEVEEQVVALQGWHGRIVKADIKNDVWLNKNKAEASVTAHINETCPRNLDLNRIFHVVLNNSQHSIRANI